MTYLQAVNAVLRRLRENEVSSVSQTAYSKLIGDFVNDAKREVEDAWNWIRLRSTVQITTTASTFRYTLTGAGNRFRTLHVFNDTDDMEMRVVPSKVMTQWFNGTGTVENGSPAFYDYNGDSSGDPNVDVWPVPDGVYTLNFDMVIPQTDLSSDSDVMTINSHPVVLGAYAKALSERGEDGGQQFGEALMAYNMALSDAIALDARNTPFETIWTVE